MAGYIIHLAVGKQFLKKNKGYNKEEFLRGIIAPDQVDNKITTHFSKLSAKCNLEEFFNNYKLDKGYYSGWLLHLITDIMFYRDYLNNWDDREDKNRNKLLQDYDILNKELIEDYGLQVPENIKEYAMYKEGKTTYIDKLTIKEFIDKVSNTDIEKIKDISNLI